MNRALIGAVCMRSFTGFPAGAALCKVWTSCESCTGISQTSGGSSKTWDDATWRTFIKGYSPVILLPVSTLKNSGKKRWKYPQPCVLCGDAGRIQRRRTEVKTMPDIKTRDVVKGTVKVIDKSAVAADG